MYYLLDLERLILSGGIAHYWKANRNGYACDIREAGLFDEPVAKRLVQEDFDKRTIMIDEKTIKDILNRG
jgi:hypothetical protein